MKKVLKLLGLLFALLSGLFAVYYFNLDMGQRAQKQGTGFVRYPVSLLMDEFIAYCR